ncbi:hypothetical protein ABIE64_004370 [Thalassospira sp. MBR-102]|jgi:hypothetical protein|uniref:hypothetical protein n=1 Tax=unclassified Thalassospira TaxID=2648997 RepID=UPI0007AD72E7|nr:MULTISPECIES: hypothetical protein [unclassified Thalassospira]KZB64658.1 hypothetical protein AUQ42_14660 [Thalassospira sp. MCCC 1A02491]MBP3128286.1 hypothetical protein [Thalassospira sp. ER-Se-21-Dark]
MSSSFIAVFLLVFGGAANAQIYSQKSDYLDWDYAVSLWTNYTRADAVSEWDRVMPVYEANKELVVGSREEVLRRLAKHPEGDLIQRGYDLHRVYEVWKHVYRAVTNKDKAFAWNEWKQAGSCWTMEQRNVFTHSCRDLPDWRTKNDVKRDNTFLAGN